MNHIVLFQSNNNNNYIYNLSLKALYCVDDISYEIMGFLEKGKNIHQIEHHELKTSLTEEQLNRYKNKIATYIATDTKNDEKNIVTDTHEDVVKFYMSNNPQIVFEVTQRCNLNCKYCIYSDFYDTHEKRENKDINLDAAKSFIKYVFDFCNSHYNVGTKNEIIVTYYGGEPLLRFDIIESLTLYAKNLENERISFKFSMTTNAVFLDKYMHFLQFHKFRLLLSLDGNQYNNSYRVFKNGEESFPIVIKNIKNIKEKYPEYFKKNIEFNSVLHNRNCIQEINEFILSNFEKKPFINELTSNGIIEDKKDELLKIYKNMYENIHSSEDYFQELHDADFSSTPDYIDAMYFVYYMYNLSYVDYKHLLLGGQRFIQATSTCVPFERKIFITATGKILPCENTPHKYNMGFIDEDGVHIDFEEIANQYSTYLKQVNTICKTCYRVANCIQCVYFLNLNKEEKPYCYGYLDKAKFAEYLKEIVSYMENYPETFRNVIVDAVLYK